jgi:hypothetical protein
LLIPTRTPFTKRPYVDNSIRHLNHGSLSKQNPIQTPHLHSTSRLTQPPQNNSKKSLKDLAKENPTQLGDPVSLKAETSDTRPTPDDTGALNDNKASGGGKTLKQRAEEKLKTNPTMLGDPVSLKAETSDTEPTADDRGALGTSKNSGKPKM